MKQKLLNIIIYILIPLYGLITFYGIKSVTFNTLISLSFLVLLILFKNGNKDKKINKLYLSLSMIYAVFFVIGTSINLTLDNFTSSFIFTNTFNKITWLYSFTWIFYNIISYLVLFIKNNNIKFNFIKNNVFLKVFIVLIICYIPYLIAFYPALMSPDSMYQWCQSIGDCAITNHHPVIHTLFIKIFSSIGLLFNSSNFGALLYSIFQMTILALSFSYLISYLYKKKCSSFIIAFSVLFYALMPVFGLYSITIWKDVLFGVIAMLLTLQIFKLLNNDLKKSDIILIILLTIIVSLLRSNGLYAVILTFICMLSLNKERRKYILVLIGLPLLFSGIIKYVVYPNLNIKEGHFVENLAIPLGQISSVVKLEGDLDLDSYKFINNLVPISTIREKYNPSSIDTIKFSNDFNNKYLEENKKEFFLTWFKLLKKYPKEYVETYLRQTYGFYYPLAQGYAVHLWEIEDNDYGLSSKTNILTKVLTKYFYYFYNAPVVKYLTSDATMLWILLFTLFISIKARINKYILPLILPFSVWLSTMIATPVAYHPRYTFVLYCILPIMLYIIECTIHKKH